MLHFTFSHYQSVSKMIRDRRLIAAIAFFIFMFAGINVDAQTTAFNYQGSLKDGGTPATGSFQMQFKLFDSLGGAGQIGSTITDVPVAITEGTFRVKLDFGANALSGADRWLEIALRHNSGEAYTTLTPREQIGSSPYSVRTLSAAQADIAIDSQKLGGIAASEFVTSTTGGNTFIRNSIVQQATSNFNVSGNGTAGSLNVNGAASLGGIVPPAAAPAGQGRIYFDSASNKVKISENNGAFVNLVGATGVSGSGITNTIPFWSAGTTLGSSLISQAGGTVLLPGFVNFAATASGNKVSFGSPNSETGMTISGPTGRSDIRFDGTTLRLLSGPAGPPPSNGIGVTPSGVTLPNNVGLAAGAQGNAMGFGSPNGETGLSISGAGGRADLRFDGLLKLVNGPADGPPPATNGIAINTSGNVGIGTVTPNTRLTLTGGAPWTSNSWTASMNLQNASAFGWEANSSGQRFGIGQTNGGLLFFRTNSVFGNSSAPANYDLQITDTGNVTQARDKGGLVKAMIQVNPFLPPAQYIVRCYNGFTNASTGNCGLSVTRTDTGTYLIDFGFRIDDRFLSATSNSPGRTFSAFVNSANVVRVDAFNAILNNYDDGSFFLFIY